GLLRRRPRRPRRPGRGCHAAPGPGQPRGDHAGRPLPQAGRVIYRELPGFRPLELDLTAPDDAVATIVYLHGGGWRRGSRLTPLPGFEHLAEDLAAQGF